jgi:CDP-glycerol glycerophosphotransferase (TagB/SpsB family)
MSKVAVYFYGGLAEVYQLEQWLPVFEELNKHEELTIVCRSRNVYVAMLNKTKINLVYLYTLEELSAYYENKDFKVILYVNNGTKNFQSLIFHRALHIHLNHGESEKSSMHSNQSKAYDYVFVAGDIALNRYKRHLLNFEVEKYIKIGRPQYDFINTIDRKSDKTTILYAPTDESTHIAMRYTSIDRLGVKIVDTILNNPNYYLIYRPHPSTGKHDENIAKINEQIIDKITNANNASIESKLNAIDLLSIVDLAIFDNSSLIIDFLYFNKPVFATNMFNPEFHNTKHLKMLKACKMIDETNIDNLNSLIENELKNDPLKEIREDIKIDYLGNFTKGESTKLFISKIKEAMEYRDKLLEEKGMINTIH